MTFHTSHLFICTSDTFVETNLTSEIEPIEDYEERLPMKIGDMLLPLPGRVSYLRIRDDQALNEFCWNSDKIHPAASDDVHTQAWFDFSRSSIFPQSVRKWVKTSSFSTYQLTNAASSSTICFSSIGRANSGSQRT